MTRSDGTLASGETDGARNGRDAIFSQDASRVAADSN